MSLLDLQKTFICQRKEEFSSSVMNFSFWWNFHSKSFRFCSNGICFLVRIWIISYLWLHILSFQSHQTPQTPTKLCEKLSHRMNNLLPTKRLFASCALSVRIGFIPWVICSIDLYILFAIFMQLFILEFHNKFACFMQHRRRIEMLCDCTGKIPHVGD